MEQLNPIGGFCGFSGVMFLFFVVVPIACGIGFSFSSFVLIPPIRRLCRDNAAVRVSAISLVGLISLCISYAFSAAASADLMFSYGTTEEATSDFSCILCPIADLSLKNEITHELWIRNMVPLRFIKGCLSNNPEVCDIVNKVVKDRSDYDFSYIIFAFSSMVTSVVCVWRFTRDHLQSHLAA